MTIMRTQPRRGMDLLGPEIDMDWWDVRVMQFLGPAKASGWSLWLSKLTLNAGNSTLIQVLKPNRSRKR